MTGVSAGPYTLELPTNGVAILYEDGKQLPGGSRYLDALVQFAGEVIRLNSIVATIRDEALEEAAQVVEMHWGLGEATCVLAKAIRALKDKRDE